MKAVSFFFATMSLLFIAGCELKSDTNDNNVEPEKLDVLWEETVVEYLKAPLWQSDFNYDSGQILMPSLHYAFSQEDPEKIADFDNFYASYINVIDENIDTNRLKQLQFWYLMSQYLVYHNEQGRWDEDKQFLLDYVTEYLRDLWFDRPVHVYGIHTDGLKERVVWKLENPDFQPMYKRATFDEEFFSFAIAADFTRIGRASNQAGEAALVDILDTALKVFKSEVVYTADGWLYQPVQWWDNEDFLYAGHTSLSDDLDPYPVPGIALDSSHAHRFPVWLRSLENAYDESTDEAVYYRSLRTEFANQFINVVYVAPDSEFSGMRMTNFFDGHNGIYRYRYHEGSTTAIKLGYEPYNLSGTLYTGFYPLMQNSYLKEQYRQQCSKFPFEESLINLYQGLGPARAAHPLVSMPEFYTSGFAELNCLIAINIPNLD